METSVAPEGHAESPLAKLLAQTGISQADLARNLSCSRSQVNRIAKGLRKPGRALALRIQQIYGIQVAAWDLADSRSGMVDPNGSPQGAQGAAA